MKDTHSVKKRNRIRTGSLVWDVIIYLLMIVLSIIFIFPLYEVAICSISSPAAVARSNAMLLWPVEPHLEAYDIVFSNANIWTGFGNTILYMVIGTVLVLFVTLISAYTMSLRDFVGKKALMIYFMIPMYFGGGLIPYFLLISSLGMMNTIWVLVIPGAFSAWDMVIMRTQFNNIPAELKEAATIDGAKDFAILFRVFLPLSTAVLAVLALYSVVGYWNMWFEPMLYLTKRNRYPIQSVLREILIDEASVSTAGAKNAMTRAHVMHDKADAKAVKMLIKYANIVVTTVPILCVYPFAQKYFVKGVMLGSLKG